MLAQHEVEVTRRAYGWRESRGRGSHTGQPVRPSPLNFTSWLAKRFSDVPAEILSFYRKERWEMLKTETSIFAGAGIAKASSSCFYCLLSS